VNDLFDLRTDAQQQAIHDRSIPANGAIVGIEDAHEPGIECRHAETEHEQPFCDPKHVSLPERTHLVEVGKGPCAQSFQRCSEAGTSRPHGESKAPAEPDQEPGACGGWNVT
jgi:hypothetical protein